jgi:hypothetical protein
VIEKFASRVVLFIGVLLVPALALAQASISGTVRDASGAVLPGVTVEAASEVLIEKVRSVVTDGGGGYRIIDLRPGQYTVTFTLTGFNTLKRDGIELAGSGTAVVDAELRVGALEETITVTGEAATVDVQTTTKQRAIDSEVVATIPTGRSFSTLGVLIPGVNSATVDVGGSQGDPMTSLSAHGGRPNDQRILQNGSNLTDLQTAGGGQSGAVPNMGSAAEVTIDFGSTSAEQTTGGVQINFIPRDGGNSFRSSTFIGYANEDMASSNLTDRLRERGLTTVNNIKQNWDINPGFGGPIKRDKLWYYATLRWDGAQVYAAGIYHNKNAFKPDVWTYEPDTAAPLPLSLDNDQRDEQIRLTWQAGIKHKLSGTWGNNNHCRCPDGISATRAPEAATDRRFPQQRTLIAEYKAPLTNQILVEGVAFHKTLRWGQMHLRPEGSVGGGSLDISPDEYALYPQLVGVTEQSNGLAYHGPGVTSGGVLGAFNNTSIPNYTFRGAVSYVTGAHNFKAGLQDSWGYQEVEIYTHQVPYRYRFNNGVPNQLTIYATPFWQRNEQNHDLGAFVQDKWTVDRVTLTGAMRFDWFKSGYPEQTLGPAPLAPNRNWTFASEDNLNWKDFSWRSGASYDVFGDGKTALRGSLNKYLAGQALGGLGSNTNPVGRLVHSTTRNWTDSDRDFFPDCALTNPVANGECGAMANSAFGTQLSGQVRDLDLRQGWGKRSYNWEFSGGVQREIVPRVAVDVSYFRRWYGNFAATDDLNLGPEDLDPYNIVVPSDPRLPDGGGYTVSGLFDRKPAAFGRPSNEKVTLAENYGKQTEHWDGVDVSLTARFLSGVTMQAGLSTGRTTTDNCEVLAALPEMTLGAAGTASTSTEFCHVETPYLTQGKGYVAYTIPRIDVLVAGTFQSIPGNALTAVINVPSAAIAPSLGRPLSGGGANASINVIPAVGLTNNSPSPVLGAGNPTNSILYGERLNQLDLRFGKVFRFQQRRATFNVDLYNALNGDAVTATNNNYATLWRPTSILQARFVKLSLQLEF